jgi:hypothetical protein
MEWKLVLSAILGWNEVPARACAIEDIFRSWPNGKWRRERAEEWELKLSAAPRRNAKTSTAGGGVGAGVGRWGGVGVWGGGGGLNRPPPWAPLERIFHTTPHTITLTIPPQPGAQPTNHGVCIYGSRVCRIYQQSWASLLLKVKITPLSLAAAIKQRLTQYSWLAPNQDVSVNS